MYKVELRRQAQRALDRLPKADFAVIIKALKGLAQAYGEYGRVITG